MIKFIKRGTHYSILGLEQTASQIEIKKSFYKLAKKYHPDVAKVNSEQFREITKAYEVLSNEKMKMEYDSSLYQDEDLETLFDQRESQWEKEMKKYQQPPMS